jgi:hypothetical protein
MAHTYSHLYGLPTTGLRFFTVYGPWGRPDMALFLFTRAILEDRPIDVFNHGEMRRDFTYIDDIVEGVVRVIDRPPQGNPEWRGKTPDPGSSKAPYKIYNIGNNNPVRLMDFIEAIERAIGKRARKNFLPIQPGDTFLLATDGIHEHLDERTMAGIIRVTGMTKPTAHRIVNLLIDIGFLERDGLGGGLIEGASLVALAHRTLRAAAPRSLRHSILQDLSEETEETKETT